MPSIVAGVGDIESHRGANEVLEGKDVDLVALAEVNGAGGLGINAGVEETMRIFQQSTFEETNPEMVAENAK